MAVEIVLPQTAASSSEGTVSEWCAAEGAAVTEGQPVCKLAGSDDPLGAPSTGTLRILAKAGATHEVGAVLGYVE